MKNLSMRKMWVVMVACLGMSALQVTASATLIDGAIGFGGLFNPTGGAGIDLSDATGIDITFSQVIAANGDFAPALGASAIFNHLDFNPANTPVTPLWSVSAGGIDYSFDLLDIMVDFQDADELNLSGMGVIMATGYDDTPGEWTFSGQQGNILFSFSAITASVPEPGTLVLLGVGLLGLGFARRRKS